jgi:hypothetical protein
MTSCDPEPPLTPIRSNRTVRIIPTVYPAVDLFEALSDPDDWEALQELESLTNDRLRDAVGDISLVPVSERVSGPGSTPIMAAFTHPGPSRFSDGSYGVYYAGLDLQTAIRESAAARARFYGASSEPATDFDMRVHFGTARGELHDVCGNYEQVHHPTSYRAAQALGLSLRAKQSYGIVYDSVRCAGGQCIAVFRPSILRNKKVQGHTWQGPLLRYHWNGTEISRYFHFETEKWTSLAD